MRRIIYELPVNPSDNIAKGILRKPEDNLKNRLKMISEKKTTGNSFSITVIQTFYRRRVSTFSKQHE